MPYFPHPELFFKATRINPDDLKKGETVKIDGAVLRRLITMAIAHAGIDEEAYLAYPDLALACSNNQISSLTKHYCTNGYFEDRFAPPEDFDSDWYLQQYVDVRLAFEKGEIESAKAHYSQVGVKEWRSPSANGLGEVEQWIEVLIP